MHVVQTINRNGLAPDPNPAESDRCKQKNLSEAGRIRTQSLSACLNLEGVNIRNINANAENNGFSH